MKMFGGLLNYCENSKFNKKPSSEDYQKMILFSMIWGIGGCFEIKERKVFERILREKADEFLPSAKPSETIFDYYLSFSEKGISWKVIHPPKWKAPKEINFSRLLLPTTDS